MELQSKFIEGTNEQYSIRNDGVVISHYRRKANGIPSYSDTTISTSLRYNSLVVRLYINKKIVKYTIPTLLKTYFGFYCCPKCNCKIHNALEARQLCQNCKNLNKTISYKNKYINNRDSILEKNQIWRLNNIFKVREMNNINGKNHVDNLTKSYIARLLNLSVHDLDDALYLHHKELLSFKRQVSKQHNIKIHSLR